MGPERKEPRFINLREPALNKHLRNYILITTASALLFFSFLFWAAVTSIQDPQADTPLSLAHEIHKLTGFDINGVVTISPLCFLGFLIALGVLECLGSYEHDRSTVKAYKKEFLRQLEKK